MPKEKIDVAALVSQVPNADRPDHASKFTGPSWNKMESITEPIIAAGPAGVQALVDLLVNPEARGFVDYKARYVLHAMALRAAGGERNPLNALLTRVLVKNLADGKKASAVKGYLIRQLQVAGGEKVINAIAPFLLDEALCEDATQALLAIGPAAAKAIRSALPNAAVGNRLTIVQALGVLADKASTDMLIGAAGESDREVRMAAVWALANIADVKAADVLIKAAGARNRWENTRAVKACLLFAEKMAACGQKDSAGKVCRYLIKSRTDKKDQYIREAASKILA